MALCYSISYGIATGFITYCIVKVCKGEAKKVHPILWVVTALFVFELHPPGHHLKTGLEPPLRGQTDNLCRASGRAAARLAQIFLA